MLLLIKNAKIIYPGHELHNSKKDILIRNGVIEKIGTRISDNAAKQISSKSLHLSPGWFDIGSIVGEPGFEQRETLETLSRTAASGGYVAVAIFPNTEPVVDNRSAVQYILNQSTNSAVDLHPIAAISKNCNGEEITEMIDLSRSGAVAFSDGHHAITSSALMMRALDYSKSVNGLIIHRPVDPSLANESLVNEGKVSIELGMKGNPNLAEVVALNRDIQLQKYTGAKVLLHNLSAKESVETLKSLKQNNLFSSVSYLNLCKTEEAVYGYDTNYKTLPSLRSEEDRQALISGVNKKTIQVISSNHVALEEDEKKKEYIYAAPGATGLQTSFAAINTYAEGIKLNSLINCLAINPRKILDLPEVDLEKGAKAELTLFDPTLEWSLNSKTNTSKSKNSPFWDKSLKGGVIGIVNGKKSHFNKY